MCYTHWIFTVYALRIAWFCSLQSVRCQCDVVCFRFILKKNFSMDFEIHIHVNMYNVQCKCQIRCSTCYVLLSSSSKDRRIGIRSWDHSDIIKSWNPFFPLNTVFFVEQKKTPRSFWFAYGKYRFGKILYLDPSFNPYVYNMSTYERNSRLIYTAFEWTIFSF